MAPPTTETPTSLLGGSVTQRIIVHVPPHTLPSNASQGPATLFGALPRTGAGWVAWLLQLAVVLIVVGSLLVAVHRARVRSGVGSSPP